MAELLQIEIGGDALHRTLLLRGAMDLSSSQEFISALERACAGGAREVVLDLGGVDFIDSLGLHTLLRGRAFCEKRGCAYKLRPSLPPRIQRVFNVAGVNEYIPFKEPAGADG